jgi:hypothetical protein
MGITKKLQRVFKKVSAHDRANDLYALMSGAIFESAHERFFHERAHGKKVRERAQMISISTHKYVKNFFGQY